MKRPTTPEEVLAFLERRVVRVDFRELNPSGTRLKNRVIVSYRVSSGAIAAAGGRDLRSAVIRAATRLELTA